MGEIGPSGNFADVGPCVPEGMERGSQELGSSGLGAYRRGLCGADRDWRAGEE